MCSFSVLGFQEHFCFFEKFVRHPLTGIAALNAQRKAEKEKPKKDDLHSTVEAVRDEGAPALNEG